MKQKLCITCREHKDIAEFHKANRYPDRLNCYCKACLSKERSVRIAANKAAYKDRPHESLPAQKCRNKTCPIEGEQPATAFDRDWVRLTTLDPVCKPCRKDRNARRCKANKAKNTTATRKKLRAYCCPKCKEEKEATEFYVDRSSDSGLSSWCKTCLASVETLRKYGLSKEVWETILQKQGGKCAICRTATAGGRGTWHVDHDHKTGKVRGLLCNRCNTGIGSLRDDPTILQAAIVYLKHHQVQ